MPNMSPFSLTILILLVSLSACNESKRDEWQRGKTPPRSFGPGKPEMARKVQTWTGTLLDAGCTDIDLARHAEVTPPQYADSTKRGAGAPPQRENKDALEHHTPDHRERQQRN